MEYLTFVNELRLNNYDLLCKKFVILLLKIG